MGVNYHEDGMTAACLAAGHDLPGRKRSPEQLDMDAAEEFAARQSAELNRLHREADGMEAMERHYADRNS